MLSVEAGGLSTHLFCLLRFLFPPSPPHYMAHSHFPLIPQKPFEQRGTMGTRSSRHLQKGTALTEEEDPSLLGLGRRLPDEKGLGEQGRAGLLQVQMNFDWAC